MANALSIELHALGAESASGTGDPIDIGDTRVCLRLTIDLGELTGTAPTLGVVIETAATPEGTWKPLGQLAANETDPKTFGLAKRYVRCSWAIGGITPSVTFAVRGEAHSLYALPRDITRTALPERAIEKVSFNDRVDCCLAATDEAEGYVAGGYPLPLSKWDAGMRQHVAAMAAFLIMKQRGFQPQGADELIVKGRDDAIMWLTKIAMHKLEPSGLKDATPDVYDGVASVASDFRRDRWR